MTTYACPKGHASTTDDFCDTCGARIGGAAVSQPAASAAPAAPAAPAAQGEPCPHCGAPRAGSGRFCEDCGFDHNTGKIPTLVACGDRDLLTPKEYSQQMAAALPKSELVIVEGAGHLVQLERPEPIDDALVRLVERATPSKMVALTRRIKERTRKHG